LLSNIVTMILKDTNSENQYHYSAKTNTWTSSNSTSSSTSSRSSWSFGSDDNIDLSWYKTWDQKEYLSNGHTREKNNAYEFAYKYWLTTQRSIREADLDWNLSRIAMAKMLSYYAINVLWLKPDYNKTCTFKDLPDQLNKDFNNWWTLACQLWIMWVNTEYFKPNETVTRGQMASAISRMLYWTEDTHGTDYYSEHMRVLKEKWLITDTTASKKEKRGNLMLILMRSKL
jgi:hypothetical protein